MRKVILLVSLGLMVAPLAFAGSATSANAANNVTSTVIANCKINTFALAFGNYDPAVLNVAGTPLDATTTINVFCTKGVVGTVTLGTGANAAGALRNMLGPAAALLNYEVYKDSGRLTIWNASVLANENQATSTSATVALGTPGFTAYGRIPGGQDVAVGTYNDTLQATVNF